MLPPSGLETSLASGYWVCVPSSRSVTTIRPFWTSSLRLIAPPANSACQPGPNTPSSGRVAGADCGRARSPPVSATPCLRLTEPAETSSSVSLKVFVSAEYRPGPISWTSASGGSSSAAAATDGETEKGTSIAARATGSANRRTWFLLFTESGCRTRTIRFGG